MSFKNVDIPEVPWDVLVVARRFPFFAEFEDDGDDEDDEDVIEIGGGRGGDLLGRENVMNNEHKFAIQWKLLTLSSIYSLGNHDSMDAYRLISL